MRLTTAAVAEVQEDTWIPTICDMCYNRCNIRVHRVNGVAVKIEGTPEAPPNLGKTCAKGNSALMSLYSPHRIKSPLIRTNPQKGIGIDPGWKPISWDKERRVCAKIEWFVDQLFPFVNFVVTNMNSSPKAVVKWNNKRGTAEGWIKQGKWAITWTRLSCQKFVENEVSLSLFILAYNLDNFLRRLVLPQGVKHWSLDSIKTRLIKTGAKLVTHSRRLVFQLAEAAVPRKVFIELFCNIENLLGRVTGPVSAATLPAPLWMAVQVTGPVR